jgi:hypothetical protein
MPEEGCAEGRLSFWVPVRVEVGMTGAVFGVVGVMLAVVAWLLGGSVYPTDGAVLVVPDAPFDV